MRPSLASMNKNARDRRLVTRALPALLIELALLTCWSLYRHRAPPPTMSRQVAPLPGAALRISGWQTSEACHDVRLELDRVGLDIVYEDHVVSSAGKRRGACTVALVAHPLDAEHQLGVDSVVVSGASTVATAGLARQELTLRVDGRDRNGLWMHRETGTFDHVLDVDLGGDIPWGACGAPLAIEVTTSLDAAASVRKGGETLLADDDARVTIEARPCR